MCDGGVCLGKLERFILCRFLLLVNHVCGGEKRMKYEVRMLAHYDRKGWTIETTLIEFIEATDIVDAWKVSSELAKKLDVKLRAVVAKPELESSKLGEYLETIMMAKQKMDKLIEKMEQKQRTNICQRCGKLKGLGGSALFCGKCLDDIIKRG